MAELRDVGSLLRRYALAVLAAWKSFGLLSRAGLTEALSHISGRLRLFLLLNLLLAAAALPDWIVYRSSLVEEGHASVGSHWRLAFLVAPIVSFACGVLAFRVRMSVFLVIQALAGLLILLGFFFPGTIHTDIKLRSDYSFHWSVFAYGILWLGVMGSGYAAIQDAPLRWHPVAKLLFDGGHADRVVTDSGEPGGTSSRRSVQHKAAPRQRAKRGRSSAAPRPGRARRP